MKIRIHNHDDRYSIQDDDGLWWHGNGWVRDQRCAIVLHGDSVLQSELNRYFTGVEAQHVDLVMSKGQMSLFESEVVE